MTVTISSHSRLTSLELVLKLNGEYRSRLRALGLTQLQAGVLLYVQRNNGTPIVKTAMALAIAPATLSEVLSLLEKKRLLKRQATGTNRRFCRLILTTQGQAAALRVHKRIQNIEVQVNLAG